MRRTKIMIMIVTCLILSGCVGSNPEANQEVRAAVENAKQAYTDVIDAKAEFEAALIYFKDGVVDADVVEAVGQKVIKAEQSFEAASQASMDAYDKFKSDNTPWYMIGLYVLGGVAAAAAKLSPKTKMLSTALDVAIGAIDNGKSTGDHKQDGSVKNLVSKTNNAEIQKRIDAANAERLK